MLEFSLAIDERNFNLIWRGLNAREKELLKIINDDEDDELAPLANNDLIYLRLYKDSLKELAQQAAFSKNAFSLNDGIIDLKDLL